MAIEYPFKNMPQPAYETNFVEIFIFESYSMLLVVWKSQISLAERKIGFGKAFELTQLHHIKYWLIDDLQLFHFSNEEKEWILTDFQDQANQTSIQKIGVVTSDFYPGLMANKDLTEKGKQRFKEKGSIQHEVFTDHTIALDWLLSEEERSVEGS